MRDVMRFLRGYYCAIYNFIVFYLMGVGYKGIKINGRLFLRCYGEFTYGAEVIINSSYSANPIGGNTFCSIVIGSGGSLILGDNVGISNSAIYCTKNIVIESNVMIGGDCKIYDTDFHPLEISDRLKANNKGSSMPVTIKSGAFIGTGSIILKGSTIGRNSVIGAGAVVKGVVPDGEVWAGNPARRLRVL